MRTARRHSLGQPRLRKTLVPLDHSIQHRDPTLVAVAAVDGDDEDGNGVEERRRWAQLHTPKDLHQRYRLIIRCSIGLDIVVRSFSIDNSPTEY